MQRRELWAACVVLLLVGIVGVVAVGASYAEDEDAAVAKCSEATLSGTYLYAYSWCFSTANTDATWFATAGFDLARPASRCLSGDVV